MATTVGPIRPTVLWQSTRARQSRATRVWVSHQRRSRRSCRNRCRRYGVVLGGSRAPQSACRNPDMVW